MNTTPDIKKVKLETLLDTAPASFIKANGIMATTFRSGEPDMGRSGGNDIDGYTYLMKLLIQHALNLADRYPDKAAEYRTAAIPLTYNLAANTWIGWGEGVGEVQEHHRLLGLEAARKNVELGEQVGLGPERSKNGSWILGAHLIAAKQYPEAINAFTTSRDLAREARDETSELMAQGWIYLTHLLSGKDEKQKLEQSIKTLEKMGEDGEFYAAQYDVALKVFNKQ